MQRHSKAGRSNKPTNATLVSWSDWLTCRAFTLAATSLPQPHLEADIDHEVLCREPLQLCCLRILHPQVPHLALEPLQLFAQALVLQQGLLRDGTQAAACLCHILQGSKAALADSSDMNTSLLQHSASQHTTFPIYDLLASG